MTLHITECADLPVAQRRKRTKSFEFEFSRCSYSVQLRAGLGPCAKIKNKTLLKNICASVSSGHVLTIMGPSGAGKTTLLNVLTCEDAGGKPVGDVTLNSNPLSAKTYEQHCAYVRQTDSLWPFMTAREHITMAVTFYARADQQVSEEVNQLIKSLGLGSCQNTRVGGSTMSKGGLSGGQKRRLSLAMAMAKNPSILFLDEPTSGLDAAAAASIMHFLTVFAAKKNVAVLCTIHQREQAPRTIDPLGPF